MIPRLLLIYIVAASSLVFTNNCLAQQGNFRFEISANPGYVYSIINRTISPDSSEYTSGGPAATLRLMWHPDNKLSLGLESGYLRLSQLQIFADDVIPDRSAIVLYTLPILGVAEIEVLGVDISAMMGLYKYSVALGTSASRTSSSQWETGMGIGAGKSWTLSGDLRLGFDLRYYHIPERNVHAFVASARVQYNLVY